jgi:ferredoxin--NADP+ reductase
VQADGENGSLIRTGLTTRETAGKRVPRPTYLTAPGAKPYSETTMSAAQADEHASDYVGVNECLSRRFVGMSHHVKERLMTQPGTGTNPLRVAIIGAGPSGFYVAEHLLQQQDYVIEIDLFDRLPTPYGLVRGGVAPDHQKIKSVTKIYEKIALHPRLRFYGGVEFGTHLPRSLCRRLYHQIVYTTGAQTDRQMGIPGEDLHGSHPATAFVAWYNGHPDFRDLTFDFSHPSAAVVGVGNVAVDIARILCRTTDELAKTDIADYALEALSHSNIKNVYMLGRRGPAQAAFTNPELRELGELAGADVWVPPAEAALDDLSQAALDASQDRATARKVAMISDYSTRKGSDKPRKLVLRFLVSPRELYGDEADRVTGMHIVRNELYATDDGALRPRATDVFEDLAVGLVFRSVGYQGVPLPDVPFDTRRYTIPNEKGRVLNPETSQPVIGEYVSGWIKRGPSGVIGTNKPDALETVRCMLEDLQSGSVLAPDTPSPEAAAQQIREQQPLYVSFEDWLRLDAIEMKQGKIAGRPRVKFTRVEEMLSALQKVPVASHQ